MKVAITDYGLGNIVSVVSALTKLGHQVIMDVNGSSLAQADVIIVPGVAAFGAGMERLEESGQAEQLIARHASGQGIIGLCLGAQLLLNRSSESPGTPGLAIVDGEVVSLDLESCRIPNQGWMRVTNDGSTAGQPLDDYFYFSHGYRFEPGATTTSYARARSAEESFVAVYSCEGVFGVQFHPEKSAEAGLSFLSSILDEVKSH